jgi:hypothetical protein|uniref:RING-type domain-containing protein n=1 Tax=Mimiviridae sp. ChoanoV1 TaxID=2596887 RepID=A0A5B8IH33_9VIRU|nr:hypothetical protein 1_160 [Mimiviridae sp. ChoanoV1]
MPSLFNQTITNQTNIYPNGFNVSFLSFIIPLGMGFIMCIFIFISDYFKSYLIINNISENNINKEQISKKKKLNKKFIIKDMEYYSNANIIKDKEENTKICSICIENIEDTKHIIIMPCKHIFHKKCIHPWLIQKIILGKQPECPMCRFPFEIDFLEENQVYRNKHILYESYKN